MEATHKMPGVLSDAAATTQDVPDGESLIDFQKDSERALELMQCMPEDLQHSSIFHDFIGVLFRSKYLEDTVTPHFLFLYDHITTFTLIHLPTASFADQTIICLYAYITNEEQERPGPSLRRPDLGALWYDIVARASLSSLDAMQRIIDTAWQCAIEYWGSVKLLRRNLDLCLLEDPDTITSGVEAMIHGAEIVMDRCKEMLRLIGIRVTDMTEGTNVMVVPERESPMQLVYQSGQ